MPQAANAGHAVAHAYRMLNTSYLRRTKQKRLSLTHTPLDLLAGPQLGILGKEEKKKKEKKKNADRLRKKQTGGCVPAEGRGSNAGALKKAHHTASTRKTWPAETYRTAPFSSKFPRKTNAHAACCLPGIVATKRGRRNSPRFGGGTRTPTSRTAYIRRKLSLSRK